MLNLLHIENIAVVARADISFQPGMNLARHHPNG